MRSHINKGLQDTIAFLEWRLCISWVQVYPRCDRVLAFQRASGPIWCTIHISEHSVKALGTDHSAGWGRAPDSHRSALPLHCHTPMPVLIHSFTHAFIHSQVLTEHFLRTKFCSGLWGLREKSLASEFTFQRGETKYNKCYLRTVSPRWQLGDIWRRWGSKAMGLLGEAHSRQKGQGGPWGTKSAGGWPDRSRGHAGTWE